MAFNPFNERCEKFDNIFKNWEGMYSKSYDKNDVDAYTKLRCLLLNSMEFSAVNFGYNMHKISNNNDLRKELALIRRSEQQQQKTLACLKPINESLLENTIAHEHLTVELSAMLAQNETNSYVKEALDFALLEDLDHLYRFANLLHLEHSIRAEDLINSYVEIMPGRPTISSHRYPYDDVKRFVDFGTASPQTKLNIAIISAAEQQTMNFYMNQVGFYTSDLGRQVYGEIAMSEEQHVTTYSSLFDPNLSYLECLLHQEYTECYLYYSCYQNESNVDIKKIWEQHLVAEITHLNKVAELLQKYQQKEWQQVIPQGEFPPLLTFTPQKEYIRSVLANKANDTALQESYINVDNMPDTSDFYTYQRITNRDATNVPSHRILNKHIDKKGEDYRFEESPHPVNALRNRQEDNICVGRCKKGIYINL